MYLEIQVVRLIVFVPIYLMFCWLLNVDNELTSYTTMASTITFDACFLYMYMCISGHKYIINSNMHKDQITILL